MFQPHSDSVVKLFTEGPTRLDSPATGAMGAGSDKRWKATPAPGAPAPRPDTAPKGGTNEK